MCDSERLDAATRAAWDHITDGRGSLPLGFDSWLDLDDVRAMVAAALGAADESGPSRLYDIAFRFQDGEVLAPVDLQAGRGLFGDEVPDIVGRRVGDDEWIELGDEFCTEYDPDYITPPTKHAEEKL